jgi:hypothetical protein
MLTTEQVMRVLEKHGGLRARAAEELGVALNTIKSHIIKARSMGLDVPDSSYVKKGDPRRPNPPQMEMPELPSGDLPIEELVARRKAEFERKRKFADSRKLIPIKVKSDKPIGILIFGDPHLDDPGTDLGAIERDMNLIRDTDGLYGASIGDIQNNWVGKLARLYANQETTAGQSWQLVEWFINTVGEKWLFLVSGNHDHWSGNGDPLRWIQRLAPGAHGDHEVRIELQFPNGAKVRIAARHDWPGNSMWNPTHGQLRAATMVVHDDIVVSGHKHTGGYQQIRIPASQRLAHLVQMGSYKLFDVYAEERAFPNRHISPSVVAIIKPRASELGIVRIEHDVEAAAHYLTWLREKQ